MFPNSLAPPVSLSLIPQSCFNLSSSVGVDMGTAHWAGIERTPYFSFLLSEVLLRILNFVTFGIYVNLS